MAELTNQQRIILERATNQDRHQEHYISELKRVMKNLTEPQISLISESLKRQDLRFIQQWTRHCIVLTEQEIELLWHPSSPSVPSLLMMILRRYSVWRRVFLREEDISFEEIGRRMAQFDSFFSKSDETLPSRLHLMPDMTICPDPRKLTELSLWEKVFSKSAGVEVPENNLSMMDYHVQQKKDKEKRKSQEHLSRIERTCSQLVEEEKKQISPLLTVGGVILPLPVEERKKVHSSPLLTVGGVILPLEGKENQMPDLLDSSEVEKETLKHSNKEAEKVLLLNVKTSKASEISFLGCRISSVPVDDLQERSSIESSSTKSHKHQTKQVLSNIVQRLVRVTRFGKGDPIKYFTYKGRFVKHWDIFYEEASCSTETCNCKLRVEGVSKFTLGISLASEIFCEEFRILDLASQINSSFILYGDDLVRIPYSDDVFQQSLEKAGMWKIQSPDGSYQLTPYRPIKPKQEEDYFHRMGRNSSEHLVSPVFPFFPLQNEGGLNIRTIRRESVVLLHIKPGLTSIFDIPLNSLAFLGYSRNKMSSTCKKAQALFYRVQSLKGSVYLEKRKEASVVIVYPVEKMTSKDISTGVPSVLGEDSSEITKIPLENVEDFVIQLSNLGGWTRSLLKSSPPRVYCLRFLATGAVREYVSIEVRLTYWVEFSK